MRRIHLAVAVLALAGCERDLDIALTKQIRAQKLAADMRVELHRSAEAAQRAIMADTDEASSGFIREAEETSSALEADLRSIEPILTDLGFGEERRLVQEFGDAFRKVQELDRTLLALAVENSNVKAQRLSFGPARAAADALRDHLDRAVGTAPPQSAVRAQLLAARVQLGVREIQALQAPHIAEAEDAVMTELEQQMAGSESAARGSLEELSQLLGSKGATELAAAREQLDRFAQTQRELIALSRANTEVRSLASALGEKRELTATCDAALIALQESLAKHGFRATR
jgi:hypothetical protein